MGRHVLVGGGQRNNLSMSMSNMIVQLFVYGNKKLIPIGLPKSFSKCPSIWISCDEVKHILAHEIHGARFEIKFSMILKE